jgi:hypothetical protein
LTGAGERIRTADHPLTRRALCLLSYTGVTGPGEPDSNPCQVTVSGLPPVTGCIGLAGVDAEGIRRAELLGMVMSS